MCCIGWQVVLVRRGFCWQLQDGWFLFDNLLWFSIVAMSNSCKPDIPRSTIPWALSHRSLRLHNAWLAPAIGSLCWVLSTTHCSFVTIGGDRQEVWRWPHWRLKQELQYKWQYYSLDGASRKISNLVCFHKPLYKAIHAQQGSMPWNISVWLRGNDF
jgi:hypothetical protein